MNEEKIVVVLRAAGGRATPGTPRMPSGTGG